MKKTIFSAAAVLASACAFATVESANTFGILKLTPSNTCTVICVPWVAVGGDSIPVTNLVMTTGMTDGAMLYAYDSSTLNYYVWQLDSGAWSPATTYEPGSDEPQDNDFSKLARGGAFILTRDSEDWDKPIYLYGQYDSSAPAPKEITPARIDETKIIPSYTLIAPPSTTNVHLNAFSFSGTIGTNDTIVLDLGKQFRYNTDENKWGEFTNTPYDGFNVKTIDTTKDTIEASLGAWYIRSVTNDNFTVQF